MPDLAWVQNNSKVCQSWGRYSIQPGAVNLIPVECVTGQLPEGVKVVSNDPEKWIFRRTDHLPTSPRYPR